MNSFKRYRDVFLVVLLFALPFFALRASIRKPDQLSAIDRAVLRVAAPPEYLSSAAARGVSRVISGYVYLVDVKDDNNKLAYENARLKAQASELLAEKAENDRLRKLLGLRDSIPHETLSALVIGKDTTEYFRVWHLTVDQPNAQVKKGMPVVALDGTVGTVNRVSGDRVDVQLTVDAGFGVDVMVERTQASGFVRGIGETTRSLVRVEYVQRTDQVEVGDLLVTTGKGCRFPKGIPVARVTKVLRRDFGIYQSVEAQPSVDFSRLEEVLIILTDGSDCDLPEKPAGRRPRAQR